MRDFSSSRFQNGFLHIVQHNGPEFASDDIVEIWDEISRTCQKYGCTKVLIEAQEFNRGLDTAGAFDSGVSASQITRGLMIAFCFGSYEPDDILDFFKTVALNRGTRIEFFDSVKEGMEWLGVAEVA